MGNYEYDMNAIWLELFQSVGVLILLLALVVISIVAAWKLFKKAGKSGWKSLIPVYNFYCTCDIAGKVKFFWINLIAIIIFSTVLYIPAPEIAVVKAVLAGIKLLAWFVSGVAIIVTYILIKCNLAKAFGKEIPFAVGMIIVPVIFDTILAFSKAEYVGNAASGKR